MYAYAGSSILSISSSHLQDHYQTISVSTFYNQFYDTTLSLCCAFSKHFPPKYPAYNALETALAVLILSANIIYKQFRLFVENARSRAAAKLPV